MASEKSYPAPIAGLNKARKLVKAQKADKIYVAYDADEAIIHEMTALCKEWDVLLDLSHTKGELRTLCEIEVDCAVCVVPRSI